jgi:hypothetical protein
MEARHDIYLTYKFSNQPLKKQVKKSQLFCMFLSFAGSTKMEQKRFGVKISLLNELRLFQSALLKRRKMFYHVDLTGYDGTLVRMRLTTGENPVFIPGFSPFIIIPHLVDVSIKERFRR